MTDNVWALGDYPKLAREVLGGFGPRLVRACGLGPADRVLDLASGPGGVALAAAARGASVVAADVTPELLSAGSAGGGAAEKVEWVEADARSLPFADGEFDVVLSCIGAMFAPDHRAVAAEMVRVCRPGGRLGMINWTPHGSIGGFFAVFAGPPVGPAPTDWGSAGYVRSLFGERATLTFAEESLPVDVFAGPAEYCAYYKAHFGPTIAAFAAAADPDALDRAFLDYATAADHGGGHFEYEYLLVTGRTAG